MITMFVIDNHTVVQWPISDAVYQTRSRGAPLSVLRAMFNFCVGNNPMKCTLMYVYIDTYMLLCRSVCMKSMRTNPCIRLV